MDTCPWLVLAGFDEDGETILEECGTTGLNEHDGLCARHTRGEPLETYYAPHGEAWRLEEKARTGS